MSFLLLWLYVSVARGMPVQNAPSADTLLQRARQEGTPLVDRVEDDARYVLVMFLWRGSARTKNIAVIGAFLKAPIVAIDADWRQRCLVCQHESARGSALHVLAR